MDLLMKCLAYLFPFMFMPMFGLSFAEAEEGGGSSDEDDTPIEGDPESRPNKRIRQLNDQKKEALAQAEAEKKARAETEEKFTELQAKVKELEPKAGEYDVIDGYFAQNPLQKHIFAKMVKGQPLSPEELTALGVKQEQSREDDKPEWYDPDNPAMVQLYQQQQQMDKMLDIVKGLHHDQRGMQQSSEQDRFDNFVMNLLKDSKLPESAYGDAYDKAYLKWEREGRQNYQKVMPDIIKGVIAERDDDIDAELKRRSDEHEKNKETKKESGAGDKGGKTEVMTDDEIEKALDELGDGGLDQMGKIADKFL